MKELKCIRNLFKSTYRANAFDKDKTYTVESIEGNMVYLVDNLGNLFNFINADTDIYYKLTDYFEL